MSKYTYAVSFTILATIESDEPLAEEEIISQAELETCVTRDLCNVMILILLVFMEHLLLIDYLKNKNKYYIIFI
jgi:hypothetical protein